MLAHVLQWLLIVAVAVLLGWLTWRAWRAPRAAVKWGGTALAGLLTVIALLVAVALARGLAILYLPRSFL